MAVGAVGLFLGMTGLYQLYFGGMSGQTPGMRLVGIRLISARGERARAGARSPAAAGARAQPAARRPRLAVGAVRSRAPRAARSPGGQLRHRRRGLSAAGWHPDFPIGCVNAGRVSADTMRAAIARQAVYGGALDTALLETDAIDETAALGGAGRRDRPADARAGAVREPGQVREPRRHRRSSWTASGRSGRARCRWASRTARCRCCAASRWRAPELDAASERLGVPFQLYIVPEVRLAAVRQAIFDRPMPPRLLRLFARVAGAEPVRRWQTAHHKPVKVDEKRGRRGVAAAVGAGRRRRPGAKTDGRRGRRRRRADVAGAPALPPRPRRRGAAARPRAGEQARGREADRAPLRQGGREGARASWWRSPSRTSAPRRGAGRPGGRSTRTTIASSGCSRGSAHKEPQIRASSEDELRKLTGEYFGYHYDLPRREREQARARWQTWWYESGRARKKT